MNTEKITSSHLPSGKQRIIRHTITTLNVVTLTASIIFVIWIVGKIIGALFALMLSLVLSSTSEPPPRDYPMGETTTREMRFQSTLPDSRKLSDSAIDR